MGLGLGFVLSCYKVSVRLRVKVVVKTTTWSDYKVHITAKVILSVSSSEVNFYIFFQKREVVDHQMYRLQNCQAFIIWRTFFPKLLLIKDSPPWKTCCYARQTFTSLVVINRSFSNLESIFNTKRIAKS